MVEHSNVASPKTGAIPEHLRKMSKAKTDMPHPHMPSKNPSSMTAAQAMNRQKTMLTRPTQKVVPLKKAKTRAHQRPKPKITRETLHMVVMHVMQEADNNGNGDLDINECRIFLKKLLAQTYPGKDWDEEAYKTGFYAIDTDKGGDISISELFDVIYKNAVRQGMMVEEATQ